VPYAKLPPGDRDFVSRLADANGGSAKLSGKTLVLSLLGTAGVKPEWNDRLNSKGHLGIPLLGAAFVSGLPMVSRLMSDMGLGLDWLETQDTEIVVKTLGRLARLFYVSDAAHSQDQQGRNLVPAQDFVSANGVKTVFGVGGGYMNGTFVTTIFFTKELIDKAVAEQLPTLITAFKTATLNAVMAGRFY